MDDARFSVYVTVPQGSMWDGLAASSVRYPGSIALDYLGAGITYRRLRDMVGRAASSLTALGVSAGDRVLLLLPNIPQTVMLLYALNKLNAVAVMLHPDSAADDVARCVRELNCRVVFLTDRSLPSCDHMTADWQSLDCRAFVMDPMRFAPVWMRLGHKRRKFAAPFEEERRFWRLKADAVRSNDADVSDRPAVILFSGGTFGEPKAVVLSNRNMNAAAAQTVAASGVPDVSGKAILALMPMFHGFGLCVGVHTPLMFGATGVLLPKYDPALCARTFRRTEIHFLPGVPTFFIKLARAGAMRSADLSSLLGVFCGGDRLTQEAQQEIDQFLIARGSSARVRQGYGLTESASVITLMPAGVCIPGSIGLPLPNTRARVVDLDTGCEAETGRAGELWLSGPTVMLGYLHDDALNAATLIVENGDVWLRTGDVVHRDSDGFLFFEQRIKRMIVTSGYNVYPSSVESALRETGLTSDVCVIGVRDEIRGQDVVAFVVAADALPAKTDADGSASTLRERLSQYLPRYAIPRRFLFVDALPHTAVGKIAYGELEKLALIDKSDHAW